MDAELPRSYGCQVRVLTKIHFFDDRVFLPASSEPVNADVRFPLVTELPSGLVYWSGS